MELAEAMRKALRMGERRRKALARRAREVVQANTSFRWFLQQMKALQRAERERVGGPAEEPVPPLPRYEHFE
jgi:trehalose-6-phosphate synthase